MYSRNCFCCMLVAAVAFGSAGVGVRNAFARDSAAGKPNVLFIAIDDLNDLLRDITYENTNLEPTSGDRTFEFVVNDGDADSNTATATITVVPTYTLTVVDGSGSGEYIAGKFAPVDATVPAGKVFDTWTGDIEHLADPADASTIATMPAANITVSALFADAPPDTYTLTVVDGTGDGAYEAGEFVPVVATVPGGKVFDIWTGDKIGRAHA